MVTTESEAEKKVCANDTGGIKCCASQCMGWRWFDVSFDGGKSCMDPRISFREDNARSASDRRGYCGLAGVPQNPEAR